MICRRSTPCFAVCLLVLFAVTGCDSDPGSLEPAAFPTNGDVFLDDFSGGLNYAAFGGSKVDAIAVDAVVKYRGARSLRFTVPSVNDPSGFYAGGTFFTTVGRDLTGYDALTFWSRASMVATLGTVGFGNDNSGASRFVAEMPGLPVTTVWQKYVVPIPLAEKLSQETGLFQLAAGAVGDHGYEVWFDEVQFEKLGTLGPARPMFASQIRAVPPGESIQIEGFSVTYNVGGVDKTVQCSPQYFTFSSSDPGVATVSGLGLVQAVSLGDAVITASLGSTPVDGMITLAVSEAPPGPSGPAPVPSYPAGDVISLFSNAYADVPVDTWSAVWDQADVADIQIGGDDVKHYTNLVYAGIEFTSNTLDVTDMTYFRVDFWTPDPTAAPAAFRIKLVDFGADGVYGGGDDVEYEISLNDSTVPALQTSAWAVLDIPMADFTGLVTREHLAQLIISGDPNTVYIDNVMFHK